MMMLRTVQPLALLGLLVLAACGDDDEFTPGTGALDGLEVLRTGAIGAQEGPPTSGTAYIAEDESGARFAVLGDDFMSDFATGTVQIYLAKSGANLDTQRTAAASNVSTLLGSVSVNGAHRFAVSGTTDEQFSHVVVWCDTVNINFGAAEIR